jgi:hypothetical protein
MKPFISNEGEFPQSGCRTYFCIVITKVEKIELSEFFVVLLTVMTSVQISFSSWLSDAIAALVLTGLLAEEKNAEVSAIQSYISQ